MKSFHEVGIVSNLTRWSVFIVEKELGEIIAELKSCRYDAFNDIVDRYQNRLLRMLIHLVGDRHEAEDLLQETFLRVIRGIHKYDHRERFDSWIFSIANHLACDHIRGKKRKPIMYTENMAMFDLMEPCKKTETDELEKMLYHAIQTLPLDQRQVFLLREEARLTFKEIASLLNIPLNTALGRMHYAVEKLKSQLQKVYLEGDHNV